MKPRPKIPRIDAFQDTFPEQRIAPQSPIQYLRLSPKRPKESALPRITAPRPSPKPPILIREFFPARASSFLSLALFAAGHFLNGLGPRDKW